MSTDTTERWQPIADTGYEVSDQGRVRNKYRHGQALTAVIRGGHSVVRLRVRGVTVAYQVARLVYEAFIGPIPKKYRIAHRDGDLLNNCIDNLEPRPWGQTVGECKLPPDAISVIREAQGRGVNRQLAARFGVSHQRISQIRRQSA